MFERWEEGFNVVIFEVCREFESFSEFISLNFCEFEDGREIEVCLESLSVFCEFEDGCEMDGLEDSVLWDECEDSDKDLSIFEEYFDSVLIEDLVGSLETNDDTVLDEEAVDSTDDGLEIIILKILFKSLIGF